MYYYRVLVSSKRYHGDEALTYQSPQKLNLNSVVSVPLQRATVLGIVTQEASKPPFKTKAITELISKMTIPPQLIGLLGWLSSYYPAPLGVVTQLFLPAALLHSRSPDQSMSSTQSSWSIPPLNQPNPTAEQASAVRQILSVPNGSSLLHGDTATGKTRVYIELAHNVLNQGRSALILTPEIGLTPQLVKMFEVSFPEKVMVIHSELTPAQRRKTWLSILEATSPLIIIGPRSALFAPIKNIGLIVIDEAHDSAYKQEQAPYYQATRVAAKLANLHQAYLILGSATPAVSDYFAFQVKHLPIIRLKQSAIKMQPASVSVINLRDRSLFNHSSWISDGLLDAMKETLSKSEQVLLFLNRRGSARVVICHQCGWQALCERCDLPLTYHHDQHRLLCHTCGFNRVAVSQCPQCHSTDILYHSAGTKALVGELERLLPRAKVKRFDSDNRKADKLEQHYHAVQSGEVDIIVGTQVVGKGLDLPSLGLVGVVEADTSLSFPDYTANERSFQMLNQVIGRVGRGHRSTTVVVQTYYPDSINLHAALTKDYEGFYKREVEERQKYHFPPFCHILKLQCNRSSQALAQKTAQALADDLRHHSPSLEVAGPSPRFTEKVNNRYYWQIIIKARNRSNLLKLITSLPANWSYDLDPIDLL